MKRIVKCILPALLVLATAVSVFAEELTLYYFYGRDCPACKRMEPRVEALSEEYPGLTIEKYEVWFDEENRDMLLKMARERNATAKGVPTIIIGSRVYLGSNMSTIKRIVAEQVARAGKKSAGQD